MGSVTPLALPLGETPGYATSRRTFVHAGPVSKRPWASMNYPKALVNVVAETDRVLGSPDPSMYQGSRPLSRSMRLISEYQNPSTLERTRPDMALVRASASADILLDRLSTVTPQKYSSDEIGMQKDPIDEAWTTPRERILPVTAGYMSPRPRNAHGASSQSNQTKNYDATDMPPLQGSPSVTDNVNADSPLPYVGTAQFGEYFASNGVPTLSYQRISQGDSNEVQALHIPASADSAIKLFSQRSLLWVEERDGPLPARLILSHYSLEDLLGNGVIRRASMRDPEERAHLQQLNTRLGDVPRGMEAAETQLFNPFDFIALLSFPLSQLETKDGDGNNEADERSPDEISEENYDNLQEETASVSKLGDLTIHATFPAHAVFMALSTPFVYMTRLCVDGNLHLTGESLLQFMELCPNLVVLSACSMPDAFWDQKLLRTLRRIAPDNDNLQVLSLSWNRIHCPPLLFNMLSLLPSLINLSLDGCLLDGYVESSNNDPPASTVTPSPRSDRSLSAFERMQMEEAAATVSLDAPLPEEAADVWSSFDLDAGLLLLSKSTSLSSLSLEGYTKRLQESSIKILQSRSWQSLSLNGSVEMVPATAFQAGLTQWKTLKVLNIGGATMLNDTATVEIARNCPLLVELCLSGISWTGVDDYVAGTLAKSCPHLRRLNSSNVPNLSPSMVLKLVKGLDSLISLDISGCPQVDLATIDQLKVIRNLLQVCQGTPLPVPAFFKPAKPAKKGGKKGGKKKGKKKK